MIIEVVKEAGGIFRPVNDAEYEKTAKFKTGEQYQVQIKLTRNPAFHRKVFAFFNFCFEHWAGGNEFQSHEKQFNVFRQNLTVLAGFKEQYWTISGKVRIEAKSLSFSSMSQEEFEECYHALINAAMKYIFKGGDDDTYNKLVRFF